MHACDLSLSRVRTHTHTHTHTHTEGKFMSIKEVMPQVNVTTLLCLKQGKKQKKKLKLLRYKQKTLHSERHLTKLVIIIQLNNVTSH